MYGRRSIYGRICIRIIQMIAVVTLLTGVMNQAPAPAPSTSASSGR